MSRENRKKAVSIRMSGSDVGKVKRLAERLGVRDSDVIRYAVKSMLARLAPLDDPQARGRSLLPVFVESGADLFHHFELDVTRLEGILNEDAGEDGRVEHEDIQLIAMTGVREVFPRWRGQKGSASARVRVATPPQPTIESNHRAEPASADANGADSLRDYIYHKYVFRTADA